MATLGLSVANDIATHALNYFVRGKSLAQTMQDKPLLKWLRDNMKTFPSGKETISEPVQGAYMSDTPGFLQGITEDDEVLFRQAANGLRVEYSWKEVITGLIITWTELLKDGISITEDGAVQEHSDVALTRLTGILENRLADYGESNSRAMNDMLWRDGSQDAKHIAGVQSILNGTAAVGTVGGKDKATYTWWRQRVRLDLVPSANDSDMIKFFNSELVQLKRFGGKPNKALCGSAFLDALRVEILGKGLLTQSGFQGKATEIGMNSVSIAGLGTFEYDPTLDDLALSKRCYVMDSRRIQYRPMEKEDMRMINPERPYNYLVFLKNVKSVGALCATQLNCHGVYGIA